MSTLLTEVLRRSRTRLAEVFLGKPTAKQVRQKEEAELWGKANDVIQDLLLKQRLSKVKEFRALMKPANGGGYERIAIGEYPRESDEVWVEANSEDPGIRHDDLVGFVVLSELRQFLATTKWVAMFYRNALKGGCEFPVGSEALKFARRAKAAPPEWEILTTKTQIEVQRRISAGVSPTTEYRLSDQPDVTYKSLEAALAERGFFVNAAGEEE